MTGDWMDISGETVVDGVRVTIIIKLLRFSSSSGDDDGCGRESRF